MPKVVTVPGAFFHPALAEEFVDKIICYYEQRPLMIAEGSMLYTAISKRLNLIP
jgi:hypothetical protein